MVWQHGHILNRGQYIIKDILGMNRYITTYLAESTETRHSVVIKTLNKSRNYKEAVEMFLKESNIFKEFSSVDIATIRNVFYTEEEEVEVVCAAIDFIEGELLKDLVDFNGAISEDEALKYIYQVSLAIDTVCHQNDLIYKNIDPTNIIIQPSGNAVLLVTMSLKDLSTSTDSTTSNYMAPEQYTQRRESKNKTVDIYGLASTLYFALNGNAPPSAIDRITNDEKLLFSKICSKTVVDAVQQGMSLSMQDRPQSVQEWLSLFKNEPNTINNKNQETQPHPIISLLKGVLASKKSLDTSSSEICIWKKGDSLRGNHYTIYSELGGGGFGIVYLAKNREGKCVAIKTLNEIAQRRKDFNKVRENFQKEATMLGCCSHPNIVKIENSFSEGQLPCIVMEYVEGKNLSNYVDECGTLSEEEALHYIQQVGDALMEVHRKGLLHRDVKPENILIRDANKEAVLIDFGLVKEFLPDVTQQYTENMGTHGFSPGEMYDSKGRLGDYTDVYSLAATLYYLLTNEVPPAAFNRVYRDELAPPKQYNPNISDVVNSAILKGMAIDRRDRPQSVREWLNLLNGQGYKNWLSLPKIKPESKKLFLAGLIGWLAAIATVLVGIITISGAIFDLFQSPSNPVEQPADESREEE